MQEQNARLQGILDSAVDGIISIDDRGLIETMNPAAERLFGYPAEDVIGQNVKMLMPSPFHEEHDGYLANYLQSGVRKIIGIGREVIGRRQDGSTFPMYLAVSEFRVEDSLRFTGIIRDLTDLNKARDELASLNVELEQRVEDRTTELREAQEQLVRREKLSVLGQLSGGVAHEIRNPLGVIKNAVYYLKMIKDQLDDDGQECIAEIEREVTTANRIVSELLDFTRETTPQIETFLLAGAIENAVRMASVNDTIKLKLPGEDAQVRLQADQGQVERVLTNLIRNARQAMTNGGHLAIQVTRTTDYVEINVVDDGPGISEEDLENIFEPLFTTKAKGIGLGLAVSKRYAERNGGSLSATSEVNSGTTFCLTLPIAEESA